MACYAPLLASLRDGPGGRTISFKRSSVGQPISLPCGRCVGCRLERARQWAVRIVHESKMHADNAFVTLTYEDSKLPPGGSLSKIDCQLFLKRLRARLEPLRVRFFLAGEYGELCACCGSGAKVCRCAAPVLTLGRPHYHAIIFGFGFPDRRRLSGEGERTLYSSGLLSSVWGNGLASFGSVTFDSASYVANYAQKKVVGKAADGRSAAEYYGGRSPEFLLMSRRPGIGRSWIDRFRSDVYPRDEVISNGKKARPPRYYDQVNELVDPDGMANLRVDRAAAAMQLEEYVSADGVRRQIQPSRNVYRMKVREVVAKAKLAQKVRRLGGS